MNFFESLLYGLVSGFSQILPISSSGHQQLMMSLFGLHSPPALLNLLAHVACLAAIVIGLRPYLLRLRKERMVLRRKSRRKNASAPAIYTYDIRLIQTAALPMLIGMLLHFWLRKFSLSILIYALLFFINGLVLLFQEYLSHGNKDSKKLTGVDSIFLGFFSALGVIPGISRVGVGLSYCIARGADQKKACSWILTLSIPALLMLIVLDLIDLFSFGFGIASFTGFVFVVAGAAAAFGAAYLAVHILRYFSQEQGYIGFSYYSIGAAILCLILFLTV